MAKLKFRPVRFERWLGSQPFKIPQSSLKTEDFIVPLDVFMVWHSYLLNPGYGFVIVVRAVDGGDPNLTRKFV